MDNFSTKSNRKTNSRKSLPALTGLRIFLAAHVLVFHFAHQFFGPSRFAQNLVRAGSSAIPTFFLLSGFILTYAHALERPSIYQARRRFWLARFLRIYPAYFLAFLLSAPFALVQFRNHPPSIHTLVNTGLFLLLLQSWIPGLWSYWNYPAWSLSVEAFFYALFPLIVSHIPVSRWHWFVMLGVVWLAGLLVPAVMLSSHRFDWLLMLPIPISHLSEFVFGMIMGNHLLWYFSQGRQSSNHGLARGWQAPLAATAAVVLYGSGWFPNSLIDHGLFAPLIGCILWGLAIDEGFFSRILGSKPILYLGELSYGVYIFQFPVFTACVVVTKRLHIPWDLRSTFVICCAVLVCVSCLSFELIEKPLRRAGMERYAESVLRSSARSC
jgi:peptidoglycan/LPS O-acetylase OafA/YrhL